MGKNPGGLRIKQNFCQLKDTIEKFQYVWVVGRFFPTFPLQIIILCTFAHFEHIMLVALYNILHNMLVAELRGKFHEQHRQKARYSEVTFSQQFLPWNKARFITKIKTGEQKMIEYILSCIGMLIFLACIYIILVLF